VLITHH